MVITMVIIMVTTLVITMVTSIVIMVIFIKHTDVADFIIVNYGTNLMVG